MKYALIGTFLSCCDQAMFLRKDEYRLSINNDNAKLNDGMIAFEINNSRINSFYKNIYKNDNKSEKIMLKVS